MIISYLWDFGDGEISSGISSAHVYKQSGEYTVTLFITDNNNNTANKSIILTVTFEGADNESEELKIVLPFNFNLILFGILIALIICLALVFRNKIELYIMHRTNRKIEKLKKKLHK